MADPRYGEQRALMLLCGDDDACDVAASLARDLGFEAIRVGNRDKARLLEPLGRLWIELAIMQGLGREVAFGLLRR